MKLVIALLLLSSASTVTVQQHPSIQSQSFSSSSSSFTDKGGKVKRTSSSDGMKTVCKNGECKQVQCHDGECDRAKSIQEQEFEKDQANNFASRGNFGQGFPAARSLFGDNFFGGDSFAKPMDFSFPRMDFPKIDFRMPKMPFGNIEEDMKNMMHHQGGNNGGKNGDNNNQMESYSSSGFYDSEGKNGKAQEHKDMSSQKTECKNGVCKTVVCHNGKCKTKDDEGDQLVKASHKSSENAPPPQPHPQQKHLQKQEGQNKNTEGMAWAPKAVPAKPVAADKVKADSFDTREGATDKQKASKRAPAQPTSSAMMKVPAHASTQQGQQDMLYPGGAQDLAQKKAMRLAQQKRDNMLNQFH